ncbi:phenylacetic acid degradation protein [Pseudomonas chlororaphis subsp. aurantiaca]|uniref:hotdog fold domain-containing protein n=1 Tax=Pseudomonas chlororaphis TaxID=587753 RepID=UPI00050D7FB2|nr:hotdog fold domain-containing protein [Pseudomonas chlororaphis]AIS13327.1 phenylacetic acid degradation protein [Pseudomonas chlororaphis subsp. aurantiaca]
MSQVLNMFSAAGPEKFSQMACQMAPYFNTINPLIAELSAGRSVVRVPFRKEITNHLGTVHAIALCNAAELAAGVMTDVSIPAGARWIPKGMTVEYLAKAKTSVRAVADGGAVDWSSSGDKIVAVEIYDEEDLKVFSARITMNVKTA